MKTASPDKSLIYRDVFEAGAQIEPAWNRYSELRKDALASLLKRGLGTRGLEDWVHGNAGSLNSGEAVPLRGVLPSGDRLTMTSLADSYRLVFVNGVFEAEQSEISELPKGVLIQPLAAGAESEYVGTIADDNGSSFTALNTVFWRDGLQLVLADGVVLERPVELVFANDPGGEPSLVPVRNLIKLGAGSAVTVVERFTLSENGVVEHPLTEVVCGPEAVARHVKIVGGVAAGEHQGSTHVIQQAGSRYHSWEILTGGLSARRELYVDLTEPGAHCDLNALYLGASDQRFDLRTRVNHGAPECETHELYKGILDEKSRAVFDGLINVARDSQQTSAHQTNRNLLLSDDAVVNSIPRLEIYADDVKCSHGSTTGQLEDEQLFYLRTRGFSAEQAKTYLAWAFASEVVETIPVAELRTELSTMVTEHLNLNAARPGQEQS